MSKVKKNIPLIVGLVLLAVGIVFTILENALYGGIDEHGVLQESLFLPLGAICIAIGLLVLCYVVIRKTLAEFAIRRSRRR